jgi:hypothetical protein
MLGLFNAAIQTTLLNVKQQNGVTTKLEDAAVAYFNLLCYYSPGGSEESKQLSEHWIHSTRFDIEASKI